MSKNAMIGVLVAVLVVGGGYLLLQNKPSDQGTPANTSTNTNVNTPPVSTTTTTSVTVPKPDAPIVTTGQTSFVSSSTAVVNGQVKPNGSLTSYWFEYGESTALGARTISQQIGSGYSTISTPAYITGLKPLTVYYFRLSAKNGFGTVNGSTYTFETNNNPPIPGVAPEVRTNNATAIFRNTATINGQVNPKSYETNYWFEYGQSPDLGNTTVFSSAGDGNSLMSVSSTLSGLEPLTKYYFRLNAQNQYGTVNGTINSFTTNGPASVSAPSVVTTAATNININSARLNGRINPNGDTTDYWFEYSQDSLLGTLIGSGTPVQTLSAGTSNVNVSANINGLAHNTKYYYHLVARNSQGTITGSILSFTTRE